MNTMSQLEILTKNLLGFVDTKARKKTSEQTSRAKHKVGSIVKHKGERVKVTGEGSLSPYGLMYEVQDESGNKKYAPEHELEKTSAGEQTQEFAPKTTKKTNQPVAGPSPAASILTGQSSVVSAPTAEENTPNSTTIGGEKKPKRTKADMDEEKQRLSKVKFPLPKVEDVGEVAKRARENANIEDISSSGGESEKFNLSELRHAGRALFERPPYRGNSDPKRIAMRQRFNESMFEQTREGDFTPEEISKEQELLERRRQRQSKEPQSFKTPKTETPTSPKPAETGKLTVGDGDAYDFLNEPEPEGNIDIDDSKDPFEATEFDVPDAPSVSEPKPRYQGQLTKLDTEGAIDTSVGEAPKPDTGTGEEFPEVLPVEKDNYRFVFDPSDLEKPETPQPKIPKPKFDTDYTARHVRTGQRRTIRLNESAKITYGGVTDQGKHRWKVRRSDVVEKYPDVLPVEKDTYRFHFEPSDLEYPVHPIGPSRSSTPKKTRSSGTEYPEVLPVGSSEPRSRSRSENRPPEFRVPEGGRSAPEEFPEVLPVEKDNYRFVFDPSDLEKPETPQPKIPKPKADSGFDWSELTPSSRSRKPKSMLVQFTKDMLGVDPEAYGPHDQENDSQEEWYEFFLEPEEEWQEQAMRGTKANPCPTPRMNSNQPQHSGHDYNSPELQGIASTMTPLPSFDDDYEQEDPETKMFKLLDRASKFFYRMSREKNLGQRHRDEAEEIRQGVLSSLPGAMGKVEEKSKGPNVTKSPAGTDLSEAATNAGAEAYNRQIDLSSGERIAQNHRDVIAMFQQHLIDPDSGINQEVPFNYYQDEDTD